MLKNRLRKVSGGRSRRIFHMDFQKTENHFLFSGGCVFEMMKWQQTVLIHFFGQSKPGRGRAEKVEEACCPLLIEQEIVHFHS